MNESANDTPQNNTSLEDNNFERREVLKGLATFPVLGVFFYNLWQKLRVDALKKKNLLADLISEKMHPLFYHQHRQVIICDWELLVMVAGVRILLDQLVFQHLDGMNMHLRLLKKIN